MKHHLNTLFVLTQKAWIARKRDTVTVSVDRDVKLRLPLTGLDSIVCFGNVTCSPFLLGACREHQIAISFLSREGRFLARLDSLGHGNVLLRRAQYQWADSPARSVPLIRSIIAGKLINCRSVLLRHLRDYPTAPHADDLSHGQRRLRATARRLITIEAADSLRGYEGGGARVYFSLFGHLIRNQDEAFLFGKRSRRPPLNPTNALLSFLYAMLRHDCTAAAASVGLDPQVGFLHRDRPGRAGLALDLMEELRPLFADRLALSLINREQVKPAGFTTDAAGAVSMDDTTRRTVLQAYQKRKQESIRHPFLDEKITIGLIPYIQARLLARYLRGDLDGYPPFTWK